MPSSQMPSAIGSSTRHSRSTLPARAIGVSKPENLLPGKKTRNDCDLRLRRCPTQGGTELRKSSGTHPRKSDGSDQRKFCNLYENVYCQRGQMENLIKLHKAQLASDRMSCHSATANQVRLALHTAAFWLMHGVRAAIPRTSPLASAEFATIRERLIKIPARVT